MAKEPKPPASLESRTEKIREMSDIDIARVQMMLDLIGKGYKVYQNVNPPECDLIGMKDNKFFRVGITKGYYELNGQAIYDYMSNMAYDIIAVVTSDKIFYKDADGYEIKDLTPCERHGMKLKGGE